VIYKSAFNHISWSIRLLFMEGRMDFRTYIDQLTYWGIRVLFADGVKAFLKSFGLGLMHALANRFGYLDRKVFEK